LKVIENPFILMVQVYFSFQNLDLVLYSCIGIISVGVGLCGCSLSVIAVIFSIGRCGLDVGANNPMRILPFVACLGVKTGWESSFVGHFASGAGMSFALQGRDATNATHLLASDHCVGPHSTIVRS
jgi:hypothetical protein